MVSGMNRLWCRGCALVVCDVFIPTLRGRGEDDCRTVPIPSPPESVHQHKEEVVSTFTSKRELCVHDEDHEYLYSRLGCIDT